MELCLPCDNTVWKKNMGCGEGRGGFYNALTVRLFVYLL